MFNFIPEVTQTSLLVFDICNEIRQLGFMTKKLWQLLDKYLESTKWQNWVDDESRLRYRNNAFLRRAKLDPKQTQFNIVFFFGLILRGVLRTWKLKTFCDEKFKEFYNCSVMNALFGEAFFIFADNSN